MKMPPSLRQMAVAVALILWLHPAGLWAYAGPGSLDLSFDPGSGVNGLVNSIVMQADGKALVGGEFLTVRGLYRRGLARLNADGSGDPTFDPGENVNRDAPFFALQPDGKLLVSRYFPHEEIDPYGFPYVAYYTYTLTRLNADGSLDGGFTVDLGTDGGVFAIAPQPDGKVVIAGSFATVNGISRHGIARIDPGGGLDPGFNPGSGVNGPVGAIALQADGKLVVAGGFTTYNGVARQFVARVNANGSLDTSFNPGVGPNGTLNQLAVQADGKVLISGSFNKVNNSSRDRIARLNANGSLDGGFNPDLTGLTPYGLALQQDGKVIVWGDSGINGPNRLRLLRFLSNGNPDGSYDPGAGADFHIAAVTPRADRKLLIGGNFTGVGGVAARSVARLQADGTLDGTFDAGADVGPHRSLVLDPDGGVLLGDEFTSVHGASRTAALRLHAEGSRDPDFVPDVLPADLGALQASLNADPNYPVLFAAPVVTQADGGTLVGGATIDYQCGDEGCTVSYVHFVRRFLEDGTPDPGFQPAEGPWLGYDTVLALATRSDGGIVVGGTFNYFRGASRHGIARLHADGTTDESFQSATGSSSIVTAVAVQADGKVVIGGDFTKGAGLQRYRLARLDTDGGWDDTFEVGGGSGPDGAVNAIALQPDGRILVGGSFTSFDGTPCSRLIRLLPGGAIDPGFPTGAGPDGDVRSIVLQPDGNILIGGGFLTVDGIVRPYVARLLGGPPFPKLRIARVGGMARLTWPGSALSAQLQECVDPGSGSWSAVPQEASLADDQWSVDVPLNSERKFFRLVWP